MTPIAVERIVRTSLAAILTGDGAGLAGRLDAVLEKLGTLPPADRRRVARALKPRLTRALNRRRSLLKSAAPMDEQMKAQVTKFADDKGMFFNEEALDEKLLAGFTLQLGDDRLDLSLRSRLQQFKK